MEREQGGKLSKIYGMYAKSVFKKIYAWKSFLFRSSRILLIDKYNTKWIVLNLLTKAATPKVPPPTDA